MKYKLDFVRRHGNFPPREPLMKVSEIADSLGVSYKWLRVCMNNDASAPKPVFKHKMGTYYVPSEVKAWWAAR